MKKVFLVAAFVASSFLLAGCSTGKNGTHTGYVTAVQQEGIIWKNSRVYIKTNLSSSQEDVYCVEADKSELIEGLRQAEENQQKITLSFDTDHYLFSMARCEGDHITKFKAQQ